MGINSVKPLDEITGGNMMALPQTSGPSRRGASAWSTAQIGVEPTGLKPYFMNSILMVAPAVIDLDHCGGAERLCPDQMAVPGRYLGLRADAVFLLHPVPDRTHPDGHGAWNAWPRRARFRASILVHVVYGIGFTTLYFRNYYASFPDRA
jgi:glucose/mannose transport system permease protein